MCELADEEAGEGISQISCISVLRIRRSDEWNRSNSCEYLKIANSHTGKWSSLSEVLGKIFAAGLAKGDANTD